MPVRPLRGNSHLSPVLPFSPPAADCCHKTHCLEHRTYSSHACPHQGRKQQMAIRCPLCSATLALTAAQDPNVVWQLHSGSRDCDPTRKMKRERCAVKACKEIMGPSNSHVCGVCRKRVCLRHRYQDQHACAGPGGRGGGRGIAGWFSNGGGGASNTRSSNSNRKASTKKDARPSVPGGRGRSAPPPTRNSPSGFAPATTTTTNCNGNGRGSSYGSNGRRGSRDRQPDGASRSLQAVGDRRRGEGEARGGKIEEDGCSNNNHRDRQVVGVGSGYPGATSLATGSSQAGQQVDGGCPYCHALFHDPVKLVEHVETMHKGDQLREGGGSGEGLFGCRLA